MTESCSSEEGRKERKSRKGVKWRGVGRRAEAIFRIARHACLLRVFVGNWRPEFTNDSAGYPKGANRNQKCRFMGKEVREISCFLVVPQRAFPLSVWRGFTDFLTQKYLHHSTACCRASQNLVPPRTNMRRAINLVYDISEGLALKLGF